MKPTRRVSEFSTGITNDLTSGSGNTGNGNTGNTLNGSEYHRTHN